MLRNWSQLGYLTIQASDGAIGTTETIYFDDEDWTIRYFVVDTGGWLGRKVLISPISVREAHWSEGRLDVALTKDQVKNSPDIDTERPVSRQHEIRYYGYYGYPYYWGGSGLWGPAAYPGALGAGYYARRETRAAIDEAEAVQAASDAQNSHLRSAKVVKGYHIHATDGEIGHVDDFLIDDESWAIRYLVVDTSNWLGGRRVLIAPSWIRDVSWNDSKVNVSMTKESVKNSPEYDPAGAMARPYEERLHSHYGTAGYWSDSPALTRLDESDLQVVGDHPDVKDWVVEASDGERIGTVEHLIVDPSAMKVRYLEVGLDEGLPGVADKRDVLIPLELVDLDQSAETVRVRAISAESVSRLPAFTGFPLSPGYDEQFRSGTGVAAPGSAPSTTPSREVRVSRTPDGADRSRAGSGGGERIHSSRPLETPMTSEQVVNRGDVGPDRPNDWKQPDRLRSEIDDRSSEEGKRKRRSK